MQETQAIGYPAHYFDNTELREKAYLAIETSIFAEVSYDYEVAFSVIEEELSSPEDVCVLHGGEDDAFLTDLFWALVESFYHFEGIEFLFVVDC